MMYKKLNLYTTLLLAIVLAVGCKGSKPTPNTPAARAKRMRKALEQPKAKSVLKQMEEVMKDMVKNVPRTPGQAPPDQMPTQVVKNVVDRLIGALKDSDNVQQPQEQELTEYCKQVLAIFFPGTSDDQQQKFMDALLELCDILIEAHRG